MCRKRATPPAGNTKAITNRPARNYLSPAATSRSRAAFPTKPSANCANADTTCVSTSAATAVTKPSKSKCTMASAFTSARVNHAKTARRQDTEVRRLDRVSPYRVLVFLRFEFGELLFSTTDIGFAGAAEDEKFLLSM